MNVLVIAIVLAQAKGKAEAAHPKVDQQRVDSAIEKGCEWLLSKTDLTKNFAHARRNQAASPQSYLELVVLTLAHSGFYDESNAKFKELVDAMIAKPIPTTYTASIQAMALQKIDPKKYQWRIAQCGQFLADNQAENGQWDYGEPTTVEQFKPPDKDAPAVVVTEPAKKIVVKKYGAPGNTSLLPQVPVHRQRKGPPSGDNSNSQYAALGVRACIDAGVQFDKDLLLRARKWWLESQNKDGGWGYCASGTHNEGDAPDEDKNGDWSYGSMSVGGLGALCIYNFYLNEEFKNHPSVIKALGWITAHYDVKKNPKHKDVYVYYLYGLERGGILYGSEKFGPHEWYPDGAQHLLEIQKPSGEWDVEDDPVLKGKANTCFAILFLRRGMRPLVKITTADSAKEKK